MQVIGYFKNKRLLSGGGLSLNRLQVLKSYLSSYYFYERIILEILEVHIFSYFMFPDTSLVGEIIGAGFLVAVAVQIGILKRILGLNDIEKI
jgi:hypothetical protein